MPGRGLRILGHPVHPLLTTFPLGLWSTSVVWDVVDLVRPEPLWSQMAFWTLALGLIAFLPTAVTGFLDVLNVPEGERVETISSRHMMAAFGAAAFFAVSLVLRRFQEAQIEPNLPLVLSGVGLILLLVAGWHGAEMVFNHGVGVEVTPDREPEPAPPP